MEYFSFLKPNVYIFSCQTYVSHWIISAMFSHTEICNVSICNTYLQYIVGSDIMIETVDILQYSKQENEIRFLLYISGKTGDWKNHFTVAESELYDEVIQRELQGYDIPFKFV